MPRKYFVILRRIYGIMPGALRRAVWLVFVLMTVLSITELVSIMALTGFFAMLHNPSMVMQWPLVLRAAEHVPELASILADPRRCILWASLVPICLILGKNILSACVSWRSSMVSEQLAALVGTSIMRRYVHMPYAWHATPRGSEVLTRVQWRFDLGQLLLNILLVFSNAITVLLLFAGLIWYSPTVTLFAFVVLGLVSFTTFSLLRRKLDVASHKAATARQEENDAIVTVMGAIRDVIIFQKQTTFLDAIARHVRQGMRPRAFLTSSPTVPTWTLESAGFLMIWATIYTLYHVQDASVQTIVTTVALLALTAWRVLPTLNRMVGATVNVRALETTGLSCLAYYEDLMQSEVQPSCTPAAGFLVQRDIVFDHVFYRYPGSTQDAVSDICCRIVAGSTFGLLGRSGAGKSTFLNLLSGLLEPTRGRILVDGRSMQPAEYAAYRRQIGYVPQKPTMLPGSVAANIAFMDWGQALDMQRVKDACQQAAMDFLGSDFVGLSRAASELSGGQQQRVSIARSFYCKPRLLIFDEATSSLDQANEHLIQDAVAAHRGHLTCIIAAHRLSTLEICDHILWLADGKVQECGTGAEVLQHYQKEMASHAT